MKKINLAITGCFGRMGQQLVKSSKSAKNLNLVSITENRIINKKVSGLRPQLNSESAFKNANIIIDFTVPKCTLEVLKIVSNLKKRVFIGTTGFSKKEENLIKKNITVNCVSPGFIATDMTMNIAEKVKIFLTSRIPMGKLGTGEDVSNCAAFLSSEQASYVTGETIHVNGGMYMS